MSSLASHCQPIVGDGARNVALLYLFGSGGGQALCPLVTYLMDVSGVPQNLLWRWILGAIQLSEDPYVLHRFAFRSFRCLESTSQLPRQSEVYLKMDPMI